MKKNILLIIPCFLLQVMLFSQQSSKHPNIIYIYADDLGYGELGCYGQQKIQTPNLDQLAREGMRFTRHYSGAPVCAPARCMLMTGKHAGHSYVRGNYEMGGFEDDKEGGQMPLPENTYTLARMLKNSGYATALVGKWGMGVVGTSGTPLKQGFDYYYGLLDQKQAHNYYPTHLWENDKWDSLDNQYFRVHGRLDSSSATEKDFQAFKGKVYAPEKMTEKALHFIERNRNDLFFLYLAYPLPHLGLQVPDAYVNQYKGKFSEKPYWGNKGYNPVQYPHSTYAAMITFLDEQVGKVLDKIKKLGLDNNTIIIFSSDNGTTFTGGVDADFFNSLGGLRGFKMDLYEGGIRVPMLARWPGNIPAGVVTDHVSTQYDVMATFAELTDIKLENTDGISFLPTLKGNNVQQSKHNYLYFEYPENGGQIAVMMGNWKGVKRNIRKVPDSPWQLFNLKEDPFETKDLSAEQFNLIQKFNEIVIREHQHPHIMEWEFLDPKIKAERK